MLRWCFESERVSPFTINPAPPWTGVTYPGIGELDHLLDFDQLTLARSRGDAFGGFSEARVTFHPTYKFDKASEESVGRGGCAVARGLGSVEVCISLRFTYRSPPTSLCLFYRLHSELKKEHFDWRRVQVLFVLQLNLGGGGGGGGGVQSASNHAADYRTVHSHGISQIEDAAGFLLVYHIIVRTRYFTFSSILPATAAQLCRRWTQADD